MSRIAFCEASGVLADLTQKLGGNNGEAVLRRLKKFLRGENTDSLLCRLLTFAGYEHVDDNINDVQFPVPADFVFGSDPKVFHFNRFLSTTEVLKEMDAAGYRPATVWDLIDFGGKNRASLESVRVIALGSISVEGDLVASLIEGSVGVSYFTNECWSKFHRFLGVRK